MTTLLGAAELEWMRAMQGRALPGSAVVLRCALTPDGQGGQTEEWVADGTVPARLSSQNSRAVAESGANGAQVLSVTRWYVTMETTGLARNITAADRLVIDGRLYEVTEVNNGEHWQTAVRCAVQRTNEELA